MRPNPIHASQDPEFVRALIEANPWATIVSVKDRLPVASRTPGAGHGRDSVPINRFECKRERKLSEDKDPLSRRQVIAALRAPPVPIRIRNWPKRWSDSSARFGDLTSTVPRRVSSP